MAIIDPQELWRAFHDLGDKLDKNHDMMDMIYSQVASSSTSDKLDQVIELLKSIDSTLGSIEWNS